MPIVEIGSAGAAIPLAAALRAGGVPCVEITLRTDAALEAIARIARAPLGCDPEIALGAGTVLSTEQAEQAVEAGARFLVAPGLDPELVTWARGRGVPMIPGVATASEVGLALRLGVSVMKFFPAELLGGARMIAALHGPFPDARFIPTGGLSPDTLAEYLRLPRVHACGGSWLAPPALIAAGDFDEITRRARAAAGAVAAIRGAAPPKD